MRFNCRGETRNAEFMILGLSFKGHLGIHSSFKQENNVSDSGSSIHRCADELLPLFDVSKSHIIYRLTQNTALNLLLLEHNVCVLKSSLFLHGPGYLEA